MRDVTASPALRWVRAAVTTSVALAVAVVAHASAGGAVPVAGVVALAVVTVLFSAALLGRPASRARVIAIVAVGQAAGHLVLTAVAGHGPSSADAAGGAATTTARLVTTLAPQAGGRRTGSLRDLTAVTPATDGAAWVPPHWVQHLADDLTGPHALMALAHLAAAALLGWWLATGEEALWTLVLLAGAEARGAAALVVRTLAAHARAVLASLAALGRPLPRDPTRVAGPRARRWSPTDASPLHQALVPAVVSRRGPPLAAASA